MSTISSDWAILNADAVTYDALNTTHTCNELYCYDCHSDFDCCTHCPGYEGDK